MKTIPVIPEQSWLHEPSPAELKAENQRLADSREFWRAAALLLLVMFILAVLIR